MALRRDLDRPIVVLGPVLRRALIRLAAICRSLAIGFAHCLVCGVHRSPVRLVPQLPGDWQRIDIQIDPPAQFVAGLMKLP